MSTILDFQIQPLSAESYSVTVCERDSSQPLASAPFSHRVDFLTDFSVDRLNVSTKDAADRFDELQKIGGELYQKLFPPAVEQVWNEYKQRSEFLVLCLRFAEAATKLEVLPWETLHDGMEFIAAGAKTTLTRLPIGVDPTSKLPPIPRPLKLFGFFASPLDLQDHERLNAEREQEILLEAINDPAAQERISADFEDEAKLEILERSLRDGYHILHFTGHGINPRDGGGLLLEDAHGKKLPASIAEVMQAVQSGVDKLRLAVISGCQTARTLHTGAFSDLSRELLRQRVPAVIAMQFSITDEGGLKFAEVLYREIAKGVALERAVHAARRVLLEDQRFFINNDALAIVLLTADGACLQTTEAEAAPPQAEPGATYLGDRLDPLAHGFYGRHREYRKIRDGLLRQDQRAVIIHGIGGIGKTALLTHAINRLRPRFKDVMSFDCRRAALAPETILLELLDRLAALPGVEAAAMTSNLPLAGERQEGKLTFTIEGQLADEQQRNPFRRARWSSFGVKRPIALCPRNSTARRHIENCEEKYLCKHSEQKSFGRTGCGEIVLALGNGYNQRGGETMSENLEAVLEAALRLPPDEQRQLAEQLPAVAKRADEARLAEEAAWLAIVDELHGTIKGLDRETIIWLAEDEELCGY